VCLTGCENDLHYVCVSNLQIVARRMLHVFNLPITRARVDGRHNEISVISEFENSISCMDRMEIGRCNDNYDAGPSAEP